jgi:hypothetical protein
VPPEGGVPPSFFVQDIPVPGMPAVTLVPFLPSVTFAPLGPSERETPERLKLSITPGKMARRLQSNEP